MSHLSTVDTEFRDAVALQRAVEAMGFKWEKNGQCRFWNDQTERCDFVIRLPGPYDIGVMRADTDSGKLELRADLHAGHVAKAVGSGFARLKQIYAVEKLKLEAKKKMKTIRQRTLQDGTIEMIIGG